MNELRYKSEPDCGIFYTVINQFIYKFTHFFGIKRQMNADPS